MNRPTRTDSLPALLSLNWVIRLELAHGGGALEQPGHLGVLDDVALDEEGAPLGVEPGGQQVEGGVAGAGPQVGRVDVEGQGVQVDDAVEGVVGVLVGHPIADGPQVVAEVEVAAGLDSGEHAGHEWDIVRPGRGVRAPGTVHGARRRPPRPVASVPVTATVSTPVFQGPVDVLLQLVNSHQVDIFDVPLADGGRRLRGRGGRRGSAVDLQVLSEFLVVAAVLVELKSRRLLPGQRRRRARRGAGRAGRSATCCWPGCSSARPTPRPPTGSPCCIEQAARSVPRTAGLDPDLVVQAPDLLEGVTPDQVAAAFMRATAERPAPVVDLYHVTVDAVTVADAVAELALRLPRIGPGHLPRADRPPDLADRDHRALPGPAGAVQAGPGLPRPGAHLRRPGRRVGARRPRDGVGRRRPRPTSTRADVPLSPEARAVEAVLIVAVEPVPPGLLAELLEVPVEQIDPICDELIESCRDGGRGLRGRPDRRRPADPDPSRPRPLRRAVRQRRGVVAAVGGGPRDPGHRGLQAARSAGPRSPPCAGSTSTGWSASSSTAGYITPVGRATGPGQAVLYATTDAFLERLGLDRLDQLPPVEDLLPGPEALAELEEQMRPVSDA